MEEKNEKSSVDEKIRFEKELEFVQLLSNASYLNYLAQYQYFDDPSFINYLKYLTYWKKPEYIKFISYPHCLFFLDQLQKKSFREECKKSTFTNKLTKQQGLHWQHFQKNNQIKVKSKEKERKKDEDVEMK